MGAIFREAALLTVTEKGFGKRSRARNFPLYSRGGKGVIAHRVNEKTGKVIAAKLVPPKQHIIIISANGIVIRIPIDEEVSLQGRATQGVRLKRLEQDDSVASIAYVHQGDNKGSDKSTAE
jgi:DNA gyrase subunit A